MLPRIPWKQAATTRVVLYIQEKKFENCLMTGPHLLVACPAHTLFPLSCMPDMSSRLIYISTPFYMPSTYLISTQLHAWHVIAFNIQLNPVRDTRHIPSVNRCWKHRKAVLLCWNLQTKKSWKTFESIGNSIAKITQLAKRFGFHLVHWSTSMLQRSLKNTPAILTVQFKRQLRRGRFKGTMSRMDIYPYRYV